MGHTKQKQSMEQKNIQVNQTDWLTFFKLPALETRRAGNKLQKFIAKIEAPEEIKDKPDLYQPEYLGNAEPIFYDNARLLEFLFKSPARFFHATEADFAFQDYRKPLVLSGINCNISNPQFSFLTIAETVGLPDSKLIEYGLILFKYIGKK